MLQDELRLDEPLTDGRTSVDFITLREFDEAQHTQEIVTSTGMMPGQPYRGSLYLTSARLYLGGRVRRAYLSMAAGYIHSQLCDCSRGLLEAHIPYRYVAGKNHGKAKGRFWQWDMRIEAGGREALVQELQQRIWAYERNRLDGLLTAYDAARYTCVYFIDQPTPHFVFSDENTLAKVRFNSFLRDCRVVAQPARQLAAVIGRERASMEQFIEEQYGSLLRSCDSKVVRFRRPFLVASLPARVR